MTTPTHVDLCWLQVLGAGGGILRTDIPAGDALAVLAHEQQQASASHLAGVGVVVYLRPAGEFARDERLRDEIDRLVALLAAEREQRQAARKTTEDIHDD